MKHSSVMRLPGILLLISLIELSLAQDNRGFRRTTFTTKTVISKPTVKPPPPTKTPGDLLNFFKNNNFNVDKINGQRINDVNQFACGKNSQVKGNLGLADGTQNKLGSCSSNPQGVIPSFDRMVSSYISEPESGSILDCNKDIRVAVFTQNLETGFFDDPAKQYYLFPQTLNNQGIIEGHQHVVVQRLGDLNAKVTKIPDARVFQFFKGLNDEADGNGALTATIPAKALCSANGKGGVFRMCSITGTFSHQPVIMPVAQRGSQDDCIRINIKG